MLTRSKSCCPDPAATEGEGQQGGCLCWTLEIQILPLTGLRAKKLRETLIPVLRAKRRLGDETGKSVRTQVDEASAVSPFNLGTFCLADCG